MLFRGESRRRPQCKHWDRGPFNIDATAGVELTRRVNEQLQKPAKTA